MRTNHFNSTSSSLLNILESLSNGESLPVNAKITNAHTILLLLTEGSGASSIPLKSFQIQEQIQGMAPSLPIRQTQKTKLDAT